MDGPCEKNGKTEQQVILAVCHWYVTHKRNGGSACDSFFLLSVHIFFLSPRLSLRLEVTPKGDDDGRPYCRRLRPVGGMVRLDVYCWGCVVLPTVAKVGKCSLSFVE